MLKIERLENQIIKVLVAGVTKGKYHHVLLYLETQFQQIVNFFTFIGEKFMFH
jgi:hypothetical protein